MRTLDALASSIVRLNPSIVKQERTDLGHGGRQQTKPADGAPLKDNLPRRSGCAWSAGELTPHSSCLWMNSSSRDIYTTPTKLKHAMYACWDPQSPRLWSYTLCSPSNLEHDSQPPSKLRSFQTLSWSNRAPVSGRLYRLGWYIVLTDEHKRLCTIRLVRKTGRNPDEERHAHYMK